MKDAVSEQLPLALARQVDEVCDRFEEAWLEERQPRIEEFLDQAPEPSRPALLHELLRIELEHRCGRGERPAADDYLARFPQHQSVVESVLGRLLRATASAVRDVETPYRSEADAKPQAADAGPPRRPSVPLPSIPGYEAVRVLGQGGMGIVYLARDLAGNRLVALKMILGAYAGEKERARFKTEAETVTRLRHPNVVQVYEVGEHDGRPFLALEFVAGPTLAARLGGTPQPPHESAHLVEALARAMHSAHEQGVVHRDLKPANILLASGGWGHPQSGSAPGTTEPGGSHPPLAKEHPPLSPGRPPLGACVPKITDFGLAKQLDSDAGHTGSGTILGTPSYMAPEQAVGGARDVGPAADVYALGAILYEMLTGRPPFKGATVLDTLEQVRRQEPIPPRRLQPKLPRDLETICLKCLQKNPRRRYADAQALADDLRAFLDGMPIQARPISPWEQAGKWAAQHPAVASLALVTASVILLAGGLVTWQWRAAVLGRREAEDERRKADELRRDAERRLVDVSFQRGRSLCEEGDIGRGMLWLARTLTMVPEESTDLRHAIRANLAAWRPRLHALRALLPHSAPVELTAFSPNGRVVLTASEDGRARLWQATTGNQIGEDLAHPDEVLAAVFSPDSRLVVTCCADGLARMWETATGRLFGQPLVHNGAVRAAAFVPKRKTLVTGSSDRSVRLWEVATGKLLAKVDDHKDWVTAVAVNPDDNTIATGSADGTVRLWEPGLRSMKPALVPQEGPVRMVAFSPGGKILLTVSRDRKRRGETVVQLWVSSSGQSIAILNHPYWVKAVAFSPDGSLLLTGSEEHTARLWETRKGLPVGRPFAHQDTVSAVAFSPDGRTILTGSEDKTARLWDVDTGRQVGQPLEHQGPVRTVVFDPESRVVLTGSADSVARLWEPAPARPYRSELWHNNQVMAVALSPDGRIVATGTDSEREPASLWEAATGKRLATLRGQHKDDVWVVAFSPDGKMVLTGGRDRTVNLWDATGKHVREFKHEHRVRCVAFLPDGRTFFAAGGNQGHGEICLWEVETGAARDHPLVAEGTVWQLVLSPDGKTCAVASGNGNVDLWDLGEGKRLVEVRGHQGRVVALAFSPDGGRLLTGSIDRTARLWDARTGKPIGEPLSHQGAVWGVAFGPDGLLVTAGKDGSAHLWDAAALGIPVGPPWSHQERVWGLACHGDSRSVLTGSEDHTARLWRLPRPVRDEPERIALWAQVLTAMELDANGKPKWLDVSAWKQRRRQLRDLGGPPF